MDQPSLHIDPTFIYPTCHCVNNPRYDHHGVQTRPPTCTPQTAKQIKNFFSLNSPKIPPFLSATNSVIWTLGTPNPEPIRRGADGPAARRRPPQGVSLPRFDHHRMQQYHHGGSRSRMPPFGRGGAYGLGQKQFYPSPPPAPAATLPPPPQHRYEVLMEAGRLAAEYLVGKGMLPPASLQRGSGGVGSVGRNQLPPPPPLPPAQDAPALYDARIGRRQFGDEYSNPISRSRRNRGGDNNNSNSSNYNGRGKRKFGAYNKNSEWGRGRESSRGYLDSRNYDDDDEDGAPGYRRERRRSGEIDEVWSSVSGVAGEGAASKTEAVGESELEDTGSKVSSNSYARKDGNAAQEVDDKNEANKMQEDIKLSNSEAVEKGTNAESNSCNASSVVEAEAEAETNHSQVHSHDKVSDEKPVDSSVLNEKIEDVETSGEKAEDDKVSDEVASSVENNLRDGCKNLLKYCSFARAPTRPRSILANRNGGPVHGAVAVAEQSDVIPQMLIGEAANDSSLTNIQGDNKDDFFFPEHADPTIACNQMAEQVKFQEKGMQPEAVDTREQNNIAQHYALQVTKELPTLASHQNSLKFQVKDGIEIYNIDTPPQDEDLIDSADKGKTVGVESLPITGAEAVVKVEEEKLGQSGSFKICDLNLIGSPEIAEIRNDPHLGQCSTSVCSMEAHDPQQVDFGTTVSKNARLDEKIVQVIDIEDDSPVVETIACDTSKAKSEVVYPNMENMTNLTVTTGVLPGIQDGYNLGIPDYLGADMPYQSIQTELHVEMDLNDSEVITVMDDPIYGSLSDIGFMEVWDQQPPDYEKFF